jgi:hypothetical protein
MRDFSKPFVGSFVGGCKQMLTLSWVLIGGFAKVLVESFVGGRDQTLTLS